MRISVGDDTTQVRLWWEVINNCTTRVFYLPQSTLICQQCVVRSHQGLVTPYALLNKMNQIKTYTQADAHAHTDICTCMCAHTRTHTRTHTHTHTHTHTEGIKYWAEYRPSIGLPDFNSLRNGVSLSRDNSEVFTTGITWGTMATLLLSPVVFSGKQLNNDFKTWFCNTVERFLCMETNAYKSISIPYKGEALMDETCIVKD